MTRFLVVAHNHSSREHRAGRLPLRDPLRSPAPRPARYRSWCDPAELDASFRPARDRDGTSATPRNAIVSPTGSGLSPSRERDRRLVHAGSDPRRRRRGSRATLVLAALQQALRERSDDLQPDIRCRRVRRQATTLLAATRRRSYHRARVALSPGRASSVAWSEFWSAGTTGIEAIKRL